LVVDDAFIASWNANNALIRADRSITRSYKEMDRIAVYGVDELIAMAAVASEGDVSSFTLGAVRSMVAVGYLSQAIGAKPSASLPLNFRNRGFYRYSKRKLAHLRATDRFTWFCLQSYTTTSTVNPVMYRVENNWQSGAFDDRFFGVGRNIRPTPNGGGNPYDAFDVFFAPMLYQANGIGRALRAPSTGAPILTRGDFFAHFPEVRPLIEGVRPGEFVRHYIIAIQRAILSVPPLKTPIDPSFRGYKPLNVPNSLALDIDRMHVGQEITSWSFMSISLDSRVSVEFSGATTAAQCCMLELKIPAGVCAFMISSDPTDTNFAERLTPYTQLEILLPAGTIVRITGKSRRFKRYRDLKGVVHNVRMAKAEVLTRRAFIKK